MHAQCPSLSLLALEVKTKEGSVEREADLTNVTGSNANPPTAQPDLLLRYSTYLL